MNRIKTAFQRFSVKRTFSTSSDQSVLFEEVNGNGIVTLNRPKKLNSTNFEMIKNIYDKLRHWENKVNLVLFCGTGDKAFCAGGDVRSLIEEGLTDKSKHSIHTENMLMALIHYYKIPFISIMDGLTLGGGAATATLGKYRIATERTTYALPEAALGYFPDLGASYFLPRLQGKLGLFLGTTGVQLKGSDTLHAGVATHFVQSTKLPQLEKTLLNSDGQKLDDILNRFSEENIGPCGFEIDAVNRCFSEPCMESIIQKLKEDSSEWSKNILKVINLQSPTSLKVIFKELQYGAKMDLKMCLQMENRLALHHLEKSDFKEGVRALLIDKDKDPKWNPKRLDEVTDSHVERFFRKLSEKDELKFN